MNRIKPGGARVAGTDDDVPGSLTKSEIKGFLEGPFLYLSSRRRNKLVAPSRDARTAEPAQGAPTGSSDGDDAPASSGERSAPEGSPDA